MTYNLCENLCEMYNMNNEHIPVGQLAKYWSGLNGNLIYLLK